MIDEKRLNTIQKTSQGLAIASLILFLVLIGFSVYELRSVTKEINGAKVKRDSLNIEIQDMQVRLAGLEESFESRNKLITQVLDSNPEIAEIIPRIFLQIGHENQRVGAEEIARTLEESGFLVPGIENVGDSRVPASTQLRYFRKLEELELQDVVKLLNLLEDSLVVEVDSVFVPGHESTIRPRQYEIWLGDDFSSFHDARITELIGKFRSPERLSASKQLIELYESNKREIVARLVDSLLPDNVQDAYRVNLYIVRTLGHIRPNWEGSYDQINQIKKLRESQNYTDNKDDTFKKRVDEAIENSRISAWYTVVGTFNLDQRSNAERRVKELGEQIGNHYSIELYRTKISDSYAIVVGGPLDRSTAAELASVAKEQGWASDAFAQEDKEWSRITISQQ